MSKTYFINIILFLAPFMANAQMQVQGTVTDQTDEPVAYANVILIDTNEEIITGTITEDDGSFNLSAKQGDYKVSIRFLGYQNWEKNINITDNMDLGTIILETQDNELEEIVVMGRKPIYEQKYDKLIFNVENSPLKQGYDGLDVLKRSPQIQLNSQGDILLRNEQPLIMINGRKMNLSGQELQTYLSGLNSEDIKRIELQTVGSAETDASNSGGVINIILKKSPTGFQSTIRTSYSHRNKDNQAYFGGLTNRFGSEKWNVYNKLNYRDSEDFYNYNSTTRFYEQNGRNENNGSTNEHSQNFNTTTGIVFYPNEKHEIGAELYYSNSELNRDGLEQLHVYNTDLNATAVNYSITDNKDRFWNTIVNYTYNIDSLGSKMRLIGDIGNNKIDNQNEVDTRYQLGTINDNRNRFLTDALSDFYNIQIDWKQKTKKGLELDIGAKLANVSRDNHLNTQLFEDEWKTVPKGQENFENRENVYAGYVSASTKLNEIHQFKLGLRAEYTDLKGTDFVNNTNVNQAYLDWFPNLYYGYKLNESQNISFSYSRRIQRPSFRSLNPFVIKQNDFLFQIGNPDLKPQYTNKFEISHQRDQQTFSLYGNLTNDLITGVYTTDQNNVSYYRPENFGKVKQIGLDYSFYGDITDWLYANISSGVWNYGFEVQTATHQRTAFYTTLFGRVEFNKGFMLDLHNYFYSKGQYGVSRTAEVYNMNLSLQKNLWGESGTIRLTVEDVFNTRRDKNTSFYDGFDFQFYQKRLTQAVSVMFSYTFKNNREIKQKEIKQGNNNKNRL